MSRKDDQIQELYENVSELHARVRALELLLIQVATIVNKDVKPLGPFKDARFYMLRNAAAMDNWDDVDMLIGADPSILDATNGLDETALHFLVVENRFEAVKGLAARGSDVNGRPNNISPIEEAAQMGHYEMVDQLIRLGAKVPADEMLQLAEERNGKKGRAKVRAVLKSHGIETKPPTRKKKSAT